MSLIRLYKKIIFNFLFLKISQVRLKVKINFSPTWQCAFTSTSELVGLTQRDLMVHSCCQETLHEVLPLLSRLRHSLNIESLHPFQAPWRVLQKRASKKHHVFSYFPWMASIVAELYLYKMGPCVIIFQLHCYSELKLFSILQGMQKTPAGIQSILPGRPL